MTALTRYTLREEIANSISHGVVLVAGAALHFFAVYVLRHAVAGDIGLNA